MAPIQRRRPLLSGILLGLSLAAASVNANADGLIPGIGGFYGGIAGLYTEFDERQRDTRYGQRIYAGVGVARVPALFRLGVEAGHTRTGTYQRDDAGTDRIRNNDVALHGTLTTLPAVDLHARVGYEWGDTSGTHYALGGSLRLLPTLYLRAEQQFRNDFDGTTLGLEFRIP